MINVGYSYKTVFGNIITLKDILRDDITRKRKCIVECSVCSKDSELFPFGSLASPYDSVRDGRCICGCNPKYKFNQEQNTLRILRRCQELGYEFIGYVGDYEGVTTYLRLYNPTTENEWTTTCVQTFLLVEVKDPKEWYLNIRLRNTLPDKHHVDKFFSTESFKEGTVFNRISTTRWNYTCPVCSNDKYVVAGACSGIFTASGCHLGSGKLSCRCSSSRKWSQQEREVDIKEVIEERGWQFYGWEDGYYKSQNSKLLWTCEQGHENKTSYLHFMKRQSCKTCSANGFKPHLPAFLYIVRWIDDEDSFIKYGITNLDVSTRIKSQKKVTKFSPHIIKIFQGEGVDILDCETTIKRLCTGGCVSKEVFPRGFTETVPYSEENLNILLEIISTFSLTDTH